MKKRIIFFISLFLFYWIDNVSFIRSFSLLFLSLDDAILFSRLLLVYFFHNCVFLLLYLVSIFTNAFFFVQPLPFCSRVCDNSDRLYNFVLWGIALVLEGEILVWYLWCTNPSLPIVKLLFDVYWLQKSGDFITIAGFNAENEILHTLAFNMRWW